ncbi:transcription activator acu-15 [Fusarium beomiforme]|uniref:Transcription activator acu-15 n=1 Tax=Fusarium beomiforme TaxID=44412 RepID=A0A9P5AP80_9HYPO|nr:transcription activator acu-15 [Fusarium beomiforme]
MSSHHSPYDNIETASHSTLGHAEPQGQKRKHSTSQPGREYGLMRDTGEHDAARFVGSGSGIHYIRAVHLRLAKKSASRTTEPGSSTINTLIPGEDDQLRQDASIRRNREHFLWKDGEVCDDSEEPSFEDFVEWSKSYFEAWHPVLPFLHGPEVLGLFEEVSKSGISSLSSIDKVIIKSILSISLADSRQARAFQKPIPKVFLFNSVDDALASSQFALSQPASIRSTQAALAIQLFLASMLCLNAASRLGGLIVRTAFHMGLHRCPARYPFFTDKEGSVRRRVFWCIYILERLLCQSLGLPLDIQDDDLDVCYPGEERHTITNREENAERLQLLTFVAKHARIRGLILELRNKSMLQRQDTADRAAFVQAELAKWFNEIQDAVEEDDLADINTATPAISEHHKVMLLVLKHESAICLNRPGLASEHPSSSYSSAFQACISAAKSILIILKKHKNFHQLQVDAAGVKSQTPLLWPSFTWSIWISAFVLIHAAFEKEVNLGSALRHVAAAKDILGHLAARDTSWPEYCLGAIDELTSTVQELSQERPPMIESPVDAIITTRSFSPGVGYQLRSGENVTPTRLPRPQHTQNQGLETRDSPTSIHQSSSSNTQISQGLSSTQSFRPQQHKRPRTYHSTGIISQDMTFSQPLTSQAAYSNDFVSTTNTSLNPEGTTGLNIDSLPLEGHESMMWYDQLFASSFSAIDNPFLVNAEFDASVDPTWNYLR